MSLGSLKGTLETLAYSNHKNAFGEPAHVKLLGERARTARRIRRALHRAVWLTGFAIHLFMCVFYARCYLNKAPNTCANLCYFGLAANVTTLASALYFLYSYILLRYRRQKLPAKRLFLSGNVVTVIMFCIVYADVVSRGVIEPTLVVNGTVIAFKTLTPPGAVDKSYVCSAVIFYSATAQLTLWLTVILLTAVLNSVKRPS